MALRQLMSKRPALAAILFQGVFVPIALLLALLLGVQPWAHIELSPAAGLLSVVATVPLLLSFGALSLGRYRWLQEMEQHIRWLIVHLFQASPSGTVILVAFLAGLGEELLFRGVLQDWLAGLLGLEAALIIASIAFGLAHFITPAYFLLATLMGFYMGLLYIWTGNLLVPILVHALYDWVVIRFYLARERRGMPRSQDADSTVPGDSGEP